MTESVLTGRNLRSARALAAKSLKEISAASGVDAWTISDFERGLTASLGEHAAAVELALTASGIRFDADGSVSLVITSLIPRPCLVRFPGGWGRR
jgi:transcriptional regulator with XRE-family HTH domain